MFLFWKIRNCVLITKILYLCVVLLFLKGSLGALPHASQQGILRPFKTYADVTLFHFSVPHELSRATWEFVAFKDSSKCPPRDVHIFLQHGSYPVMSADNASFPNLLYLKRTSLHSTVTQATFHGLGHRQSSFDHRRSVIPVFSPLPGDWFVAAFLSNWDQQLTQQGIGHKCHYSLFSVVLWSTDTQVQNVIPGAPVPLVTRRSYSYYKFYVPENTQHLSVTVSQCQILVDTFNVTACISRLSLRASALPLVHATHTDDPYQELDEDVREWGELHEGGNVSLSEQQPNTQTYYYLLVQSEAQVRFTLDIDLVECQRFDLRNGWAKLLNSDVLKKGSNDSSLLSTVGSVSFQIHSKSNETENVTTSPRTNLEKQTVTSSVHGMSTPPSTGDHENQTFSQNQENQTVTSGNDVENQTVTITDLVTDLPSLEINTDDFANMDNKKAYDKCVRSFQLTRIQHSQDFSSTFLLQVDEFFISSLLLPDREPVLVRLDIQPFLDIGGSLSVGLQLDRMLLTFFPTAHVLSVRSCLRKGRPPPLTSSPLKCPPDLSLSLSSASRVALESTIIIPFPEPGAWFLAIQAMCSNNGSKVSCIPEELGLDLDIRIQPCVFAGEPCGPKGECERTHHGLHTFSSCLCFGGFSGWGCTDGRHASPASRQVVGTLALTLSNLLFLPAVFLAVKRRLLAEALIYLATSFFSTLYHACDEPEYTVCVTKYEVLQFCDFFCSILAFWVTLISLAHLPPRLAAVAHMAGVLIVAVGVEWNRTALVVFLVPVALGLLVPVMAWAVRSWHAGVCLGLSRKLVLQRMPGVLLAVMGLALFALVETEANYQFVHSAWHVLMGLALLFLLPDGPTWQPLNSPRRAPVLDASCQELADVNDCPVFVVPTQLLLTSES